MWCKKCEDLKPLRTHHCSVCDQCVVLMDHHCMWLNNCIGIANYKQFLQLLLVGMLACYYTSFTCYLVQSAEEPWILTVARVGDFALAQVILSLVGFNLNVMAHGLTYLEYKSWIDTRIHQLNNGKDDESNKGKKSLLWFNYGFATTYENAVRVLKTTNLLIGSLFCEWGEMDSCQLNGTEWCAFYYH